jgi:hypothetical protein
LIIIKLYYFIQDAVARLRNGLDLLETCWTLERTRLLQDHGDVSETESEPGPERDSGPEAGGMGQRASSTSSLHVKPPTTTAPGRVSLTWALLKRPPSTQPTVTVTPTRSSPARSRSRGGRSKTLSQPSLIIDQVDADKEVARPQQSTPHLSKHRSHHRSENSIKRFGYDIHDVDEFLSKVIFHIQLKANK